MEKDRRGIFPRMPFHQLDISEGKSDIGKEQLMDWIDAHISDYNTDFYYQPRDYIAACYKAGEIL